MSKGTQRARRTDGEIADLLAQDRHKLLLRFPFTGAVLMRLDLFVEHVPSLETAATDGRSIWVNPAFYVSLDPDERLFVLAHEAWHCILNHFGRRARRKQELFNYAADLEIHFLLEKERLHPPFVLPHDPSWRGLSAEEIYERLPAFIKGTDQSAAPRTDDPCEAQPLEESAHIHSRDGAGFDQHEIPALPHAANAAEEIRQIVIVVAQTIERTRGSLPGHLATLVDSALRPEIHWQELLAQFVTSCYGGHRRWLPPSRRHVHSGLYLPSTRQDALQAVVALDTSGSTQRDLPRFFTELTSLLKSFGNYELTVIQCDARIHEIRTFTSDETVTPDKIKWEAKGLGGTDFQPVFDFMDRRGTLKPAPLIFFTDGLGPAPKQQPPYPVLWLLTSDGVPPADWGFVARFRETEPAEA